MTIYLLYYYSDLCDDWILDHAVKEERQVINWIMNGVHNPFEGSIPVDGQRKHEETKLY